MGKWSESPAEAVSTRYLFRVVFFINANNVCFETLSTFYLIQPCYASGQQTHVCSIRTFAFVERRDCKKAGKS